MKKTLLILGSHSFSGSSFMNMMLKKKEFKIISIFNSEKKNFLVDYKKNIDDDFSSYKINLLTDIKKLKKIIIKKKPDFIIDFASNCNVDLSWKDTDKITKINFFNKLDLIKDISELKFLSKYIYISTPEVFGSNNSYVNENSNQFNPSSPYATSKLAFELFLKNYKKAFNFPVIIARFANFYGEYQDSKRLIPKLISCTINKQKFILQGKGDFLRSYIYIDDVCDGIEKIIKHGKHGDTYHFSTNQFFSTKKVVKLVFKRYGLNTKNFIKQGNNRVSQDKYYKLGCSYTKKKLNWRPRTSINQGIDKIYNYYKRNLK